MSTDEDGELVEALELIVEQQPIELYKVLKLANWVSGGGEAKMLIADGYVGVNGEQESRKRCKVYAGDLVAFNGEYVLIACQSEAEQNSDEQPIPLVEHAEPVDEKKAPAGRRQRKPIQF